MRVTIAIVAVFLLSVPGRAQGPAVPSAQSERDRAKALQLGEELPPPRPDEDAATKVLVAGAVESVEQQKNRPIERDQHPKHHGCVRARFVVADGLPDALRAGLFREPKGYDAVIRFSNGRSHADNVPDARGMAVKLLGIEGPTLLEGEADAGTQDFICVDFPVFFAIDPKNLVEFGVVRRAAEAGDLSRAAEFKAQFALAKQFLRLSMASPLEITYFSEVPYRLGKNAVKYSIVPAPENASGLPAVTKDSSANALREAMVDHLTTKRKPASFAFRVQLQTDPLTMPVEDPTVDWKSEWITVATLSIEPQEFARPEQLDFCENLSFTPWHSLESHRPLGGINRARRTVYEAISRLRHEKNGTVRKEPTGADLDRLFKLP